MLLFKLLLLLPTPPHRLTLVAAAAVAEMEVKMEVEVEVEKLIGWVFLSADPATPFGCEPAVKRMWQEHPPWAPLGAS